MLTWLKLAYKVLGWQGALGIAGLLMAGILSVQLMFANGHINSLKVDLAKQERAYAQLEEANALAQAQAQAQANAILKEAMQRNKVIENDLLRTKKALSAKTKELNARRIADAAQAVAPDDSGRCLFGDPWVRLYDEALGYGDGRDGLPRAAPGSPGEAGETGAAEGGVCRGAVTAADVLTHVRDYGAYCRELEAQYDALVRWVRESTAGKGPANP